MAPRSGTVSMATLRVLRLMIWADPSTLICAVVKASNCAVLRTAEIAVLSTAIWAVPSNAILLVVRAATCAVRSATA